MKPGRINIRARLRPIAISIRQAEESITPPHLRETIARTGDRYFPMEGPKEPWFGPTPILALMEHLETVKMELELPDTLHFADLGSGLGNACIAAAEVFDKVTGFELASHVYREAEAIRQEFDLNNIEYKQADFMAEPWDNYNIVYFFKPYVDEDVFMHLMLRFLKMKPGTVFISRRFFHSYLYAPEEFRYLPPLQNVKRSIDGTFFPPSDFYTFVKK
jgi:SAM-dependent methyltransferase